MIYYSTRSRPVDTFGDGFTSQETNLILGGALTAETTFTPFSVIASSTADFAPGNEWWSSDTRSTLKLSDGENSTRYFLIRNSSSATSQYTFTNTADFFSANEESGNSASYTLSRLFFTSYTIRSFSNGQSFSSIGETQSFFSSTGYTSSSFFFSQTDTDASTSTSESSSFSTGISNSSSSSSQQTNSGFTSANNVITYGSSTILSTVDVYNYCLTTSETYATNYVGNSTTTFSTTLTRTTTYETESTQNIKGLATATALGFAVILEPIYEAENFINKYYGGGRNIIGYYNYSISKTETVTSGPFLLTGSLFTKKSFEASQFFPRITVEAVPASTYTLTSSFINTSKVTETATNSSASFIFSEGLLITTRTQAFIYDQTSESTFTLTNPNSDFSTYQEWINFIQKTTRRIICKTTGDVTAENIISHLFTSYTSYSRRNLINFTKPRDTTFVDGFGISITRNYSRKYEFVTRTDINYFAGLGSQLSGTSFSISYGNTYTSDTGAGAFTSQLSTRVLDIDFESIFFGGKLPTSTDGPSSVFGENMACQITYLDDSGGSTLVPAGFYTEISENISNKQIAIDIIGSLGLNLITYLQSTAGLPPIIESSILYDGGESFSP
jgi:hypothetical protein